MDACIGRSVTAGLSVALVRLQHGSPRVGVGLCGHCQVRELFVCEDGPVLPYDRVEPLLTAAEL